MRVAITGGIGSGKSMVRNIVQSLGAYTIDADQVNRELLLMPHYIEKVRELFPEAVVNDSIDRAKLRELVFNDKEKLIKLNALAHPIIGGIIMYEAELNRDRKIFIEIPLLFESGLKEMFDRIWYVESDRDKRIDRVCKRSDISPELASKIIDLQEDSGRVKSLASDIIINNGSEESLWAEVQKLFYSLL